MIVYLDTSSIVKLYIKEAHTALVKKWVKEAEIIATCRIAYPETISAITRRFRQGDLTKEQYDAFPKIDTSGLAELVDEFEQEDLEEVELESDCKGAACPIR